MPDRKRVLLVDDHPIVRDGLAMLIATTDDLEVVGAAGTAAEGVRAALRLRPDVVVMDLGLPDRTGYEATREILLDGPRSRVLVLTMDHSRGTLSAALDAGARGYVLKESGGQGILTAIRAVAAGQLVFDAAIAPAATALVHADQERERLFPELTEREFRTLQHLATGAGNDEIARRLGVTTKTVQNTVSRLLAKLRLATREDAISLARSAGVG
jgi:DNA-binding NarL/FixJ family response regulator